MSPRRLKQRAMKVSTSLGVILSAVLAATACGAVQVPFGEDEGRELYVVHHAGAVYRVEAR